MSSLLPCVEIEANSGPARGAVIWLHGLGANGHDFEPIVPMLGRPDVRFVFPHAPHRPVTINGGINMPAWYDILALDRSPDREREADIRESARDIEALIQREKDRGVPAKRIVLAGFSQGAAMAMHVGLRHAETLAGLMVLSGYQVLESHYEAERSTANLRTPMLICHGTDDPMLPVALGHHCRDFFREHMPEATIEWEEFPIGHSVSEPEIRRIAQWLAQRFA